MNLKLTSNIKDKNKISIVYVDFLFDFSLSKIDDRKILEILPTIETLSFLGHKIILLSDLIKDSEIITILSRLNSLLKLNKKFKNKVLFYNEKYLVNLNNVLDASDFGDIIAIRDMSFYVDRSNKEKSKKDIINYFTKKCKYFVFDNFSNLFINEFFIVSLSLKLKTFVGFSCFEKIDNFYNLEFNKDCITVVGGEYSPLKISFIETLLDFGATVLLGGEISSIFANVYNHRLKKSNHSILANNNALRLLRKFKKTLILPSDFIVSKTKTKDINFYRKDLEDVTKYEYVLDIGPETIKKYSEVIKKANYLVLSGLMGFADFKKFSHGSAMISEVFSERSKGRSFGVTVGNRTSQFIFDNGLSDEVDFMFYEKSSFYKLVLGERVWVNL